MTFIDLMTYCKEFVIRNKINGSWHQNISLFERPNPSKCVPNTSLNQYLFDSS